MLLHPRFYSDYVTQHPFITPGSYWTMEMQGERRLTRRFHELQSKGPQAHSPAFSLAFKATAQPSLQSAPGSLAEQAAQMEQFGGFARKTTEELFIQSFFESSTKSSPPALTSAENLGPSPVTDPNKYARGDSEELFSSWINSAGSTLNQVCTPMLLGCSNCKPKNGGGGGGLVRLGFL